MNHIEADACLHWLHGNHPYGDFVLPHWALNYAPILDQLGVRDRRSLQAVTREQLRRACHGRIYAEAGIRQWARELGVIIR